MTEFRDAGDDSQVPYRIEIYFMGRAEVNELLEELLRSYREFYCSGNWKKVDDSDQEKQKIKDTADRAWETLRSMFTRQHRLTRKFLSGKEKKKDSDKGKKKDSDKGRKKELRILSDLQSWVVSAMNELPGRKDLRHTMTADSLEECRDCLDGIASGAQNNGGPILWPFIKIIQ